MRNFLLYLLIGFPKSVRGYVIRHPYFSISIFCHLIAIGLLCYCGVYKATVDNHHKRVHAYLQSMNKSDNERRIKSGIESLAEIESFMVQSIDKAELKKNKELVDIVENLPRKQQLKSEPKERLVQAKKTADNITKIEQSLRAKDLERVMSISHEEALKRVVQADSVTNSDSPDQSIVRVIELLEKKAGEALKRRRQQLEREQLGIPISFFDEQNFQFNKKGNGMDGANGSDSGNVYAEFSRLQKIKSHVSETVEHVEFKRNAFVDVWLNSIPDVGMKNPQKEMGRVIGSEGSFADRIFINSWYVVGPFFDRSKKYPPEYEINLDAEYLGKNQKFVKWQYIHGGSYPLVPPQEDKQGIFYGYTEITTDSEQDLWVWIGADDFASVWLNETALWESDDFNWKFNTLAYSHSKTEWKNWNLTEYKRRAHFKKGVNKFFFKLTNFQEGIFFSLILTKQQ
jgi:hypothetical protein